jgi:hypothetical membrane protein
VSAVVAPVAVVGAWTIAARIQPAGYDAVRETISALARHGAAHRWIMTAGLGALGAAHVVTAAGLRALNPVSRAVQALAGFTTLGVAVFAQPDHGSSTPHIVLATVGFVLLALWPASTVLGRPAADRPAADSPAADSPAVLSRPAGVAVTVVSAALLIWFVLTPGTGPGGVAERLVVAQQALWPLVVVLALRRAARS